MVKLGFGAGRQDAANDLVIQSDGKIVVTGITGDSNFDNNNFAVARLNANGSLDTTFSGDGRQVTNFGGDDYSYGVALQADGKIVVVGEKISRISILLLWRASTVMAARTPHSMELVDEHSVLSLELIQSLSMLLSRQTAKS